MHKRSWSISEGRLFVLENFHLNHACHLHFNRLDRRFWLNGKRPTMVKMYIRLQTRTVPVKKKQKKNIPLPLNIMKRLSSARIRGPPYGWLLMRKMFSQTYERNRRQLHRQGRRQNCNASTLEIEIKALLQGAIFLATSLATNVALQIARKISRVTPHFCNLQRTKCCVASCKKSGTILNFSQRCETSCCV